MINLEAVNVVMLIFGGVTSFSAWFDCRDMARVNAGASVDDHERRLANMEKCVSVTFNRLHDRIDDLMLLVGADPSKFRKEHRGEYGESS